MLATHQAPSRWRMTYIFRLFRRKVETSTYERGEFARVRPLGQLGQLGRLGQLL